MISPKSLQSLSWSRPARRQFALFKPTRRAIRTLPRHSKIRMKSLSISLADPPRRRRRLALDRGSVRIRTPCPRQTSAIVGFGNGTALIQTDRPKDLHGSHTGHGWVYVVIDDIDIHYAQVKSAGASRLGESHDYGDGYRGYSARDLGGNLWSFGTGPVP
jgi:hypothetical protein